MSAVLLPSCLEEVFALLCAHPGAALIAGGTDLLVRLREQKPLKTPPLLSLAQVKELHGIDEDEATIAIGAATPFVRLLADPLVQQHAPLLARAAQTIGGPAIRNMATIGGNICTASPAADSLPPLSLYEAQVELASKAARRTLPVNAFLLGPGQTALAKGEVLTRVLLR